MMTFNELLKAVSDADVSAIGKTNQQANESIALLKTLLEAVEGELADLAVEHQIPVYVGEYGYGRSVSLNGQTNDWGDDVAAGDWVSSSANC